MAIYSEEQDPNTIEKTPKDIIIDKINTIISEYGSFTIVDVEADHSPMLDIKGRLSHLGEEFRDGDCTIYVYDPSSHSSDELDKYDEFYEAFDIHQLEWILELAGQWVEIQDDEGYVKDITNDEFEQFFNEWGQSHEEICSCLGYDEDTSDDLLVDDYFWVESKELWCNKHASGMDDRDKEIADYLQYN